MLGANEAQLNASVAITSPVVALFAEQCKPASVHLLDETKDACEVLSVHFDLKLSNRNLCSMMMVSAHATSKKTPIAQSRVFTSFDVDF